MCKRYAFSTGPLENQLDSVGTIAKTVWIKVLNNRREKVITARIRVFHLDGTKTLIFEDELTVAPGSSKFDIVELSDVDYEFEVQYDIDHQGALVSVFTKDADGNLVDAHRVLNKEFTPIHRLSVPQVS
jgi:CDP-glycerol glycerophosphotransferase (TagB/SpsB family)